MAIEPSPTADATRLILPRRTSPTATVPIEGRGDRRRRPAISVIVVQQPGGEADR